MKTLLKFSLLITLAVIGFSSCEDDLTGTGGTGGTGGGNVTLPTTLLLTETGFVDFEATVTPGESFSVRFQADQGDFPLNALTITEETETVDAARLTIDSVAASSNPILLFDTDRTGFITDITCLLYTSPSPRDRTRSRMPSSA